MSFLNKMNPFSGGSSSSSTDRSAPVPTEATPLATTSTEGRTSTAKEALAKAPDFVRRQASKLYKKTKEGPLSFRIFAFLGGLAMVVAAIWSFVEFFIVEYRYPIQLLIVVYTLLFGVGICIIEGKMFEIPPAWTTTMKFYFRILDFVWGRGLCYAFVGSLMWTQPNPINHMVGLYMLLVGILSVIIAIGAAHKLYQLRAMIDNRRDMKMLFQEFDSNGDGHLSMKEFAALLLDLDVDVNAQELYACFNQIDRDDDERISFDEFRSWWEEWGKKTLHRSMNEMVV